MTISMADMIEEEIETTIDEIEDLSDRWDSLISEMILLGERVEDKKWCLKERGG